MKPYVIIHSIGSQDILPDDKYQYILDNLDKSLQLNSISFYKDGRICYFSIMYKEDDVLTIFVSANDVNASISFKTVKTK